MTQIVLDDELLDRAKEFASTEGRSLREVVEEALREKLFDLGRPKGKKHLELPVFHGTGLRPGVNLDSNAALLDLMDSEDGLR